MLLLVSAALSQMDVPTRSSYVMAVVTEAERAAAASFTSVPRSLAAAASPALDGGLYAASFQMLSLLICGVKPPEELLQRWAQDLALAAPSRLRAARRGRPASRC